LPPDALIIVPVRNTVLFPGVVLPITIGRPRSIAAAQQAMREQRPVGILMQRNAEAADPLSIDMHRMGTVANIGRYITAPDGTLLAHAALASRKDARDAVVAARKAFPGWSGATAYNRGQVLYRVAEMLEGRAGQFTDEVFVAANYRDRDGAARDVAAAIDRWVWYAGWPDKVAQIAGGANAVAGPYFNLSVPEPSGVVAVLAPPEAGLLGLVSVLAPVIATGNTAVLAVSGPAVLAAVSLAEVLATSDVPGGVVNVLTGRLGELAPVLAAHADVNAIDPCRPA